MSSNTEKNKAGTGGARLSRNLHKSKKLENVCYDIRGPVLEEAQRLEEEGFRVTKLNIGNPAPFGFDAPDELVHDVILNLRAAQGYVDSKGIFAARKAVMQHYQARGMLDVQVEDIYIGNGVSELIVMTMQALLNDGDEVLIPAPDYPLWTAAVNLAGGTPVHYRCDEQSDWNPDLKDIRSKITDRTRALVIINPNNPTGAVYPRSVIEELHDIAAEKGLLVLADEIYDKILYDDNEHVSIATYCRDIPCITLNGLSKAYRAAGFRAGWMVLSGRVSMMRDYREGLDILSNMRLCSNAPAQFAIQAALGGYQSINDLILPGGRLREQRDVAWQLISDIPGLTAVKPKGALYLFPKIDTKRFNITDDRQFVYDLLVAKKILLVQGTGFNWPEPDHFRIVFLPDREDLRQAIHEIGDFLSSYRQL
ncbi:alanine-synthesizing transaminase [Alkalispirochaeta americana]|uniref:alanine transaminase n=1 Tax=Alkalispirochaeta americana TaxID=159291 RepID=A0A1N6W4S1_9SPIO|nr:pyridoxal phosphate-dependent aminotransferase [Alkalispirochaeta americana]SIQ85131.1 alanine-synthesizing transaminase [Alkalispirochaeta americana]